MGGVAARLLLMRDQWDVARLVGVCQRRDAVSGVLDLAPCPTRLQLLPDALTLAPGAAYRYTLTAQDHTGAALAVPSGLQFTSSQPALVSVDAQGVITVLAASPVPVAITSTDPVSGAIGRAIVNVQSVSPPVPPAATTLDFETGVWTAASYFQGGSTPADPVNGGFRFSRSGLLDDPLLSQAQRLYISGLKTVSAAAANADNYFVAVERVNGMAFDAVSVDIGLFDNASGSSLRRPALEFVGLLAGGGVASFTASPAAYASYGAGATLSTFTLPASFAGITRLTIRMKANPDACSSCRIALTLDNLVLR